MDRLTKWVEEIWGNLLRDLPEVHILPRGWFSLHFSKEDYIDLVLEKFWHIESAPVLLKRWSPLFNPEREQIGAGPLWVRLPGLPLQYWSEEALQQIGNALGTYLDHDRSYIESRQRTLAYVLVHLDTREGLERKITLTRGKFSKIQTLDYEGIPFRCYHCYEVGHLAKDCPMLKGLETSPKISPSVTRDASLIFVWAPPEGTPAQKKAVKGRRKEQKPLSPPLTRARAAATASTAPGMSHFPDTLSIERSSTIPPSSASASCTMVQFPPSTSPPNDSTILPSISISPSSPSLSSSSRSSHLYSLHPRPLVSSCGGLGIIPINLGSQIT